MGPIATAVSHHVVHEMQNGDPEYYGEAIAIYDGALRMLGFSYYGPHRREVTLRDIQIADRARFSANL
jgi:hypothetical protein